MRIGMMCHSSFGGSARVATGLSFELARRGHRVHLFTRTTPFGRWSHSNGVVLHRILSDHEDDLSPSTLYIDWSTGEVQKFLSCLLQLIAEERLDLLHFHYALPFAFIAEEVKRSLGNSAPLLVGTLHGTDVSVHGRDPIRRGPLSQTLRGMDGLTTVSFNHARLSAEVFGLRGCPEVIPNFVDLSKFRQRVHTREDEKGNNAQNKRRPRIIHVSNFRTIKDPLTMANIFLAIRQRIDAELWLLGDGPEMEKVRSFFERKGIEKNVSLWGLQHNVVPILSQGDLLLMSSLSESFCLSALEAMACGVPVLAPNVGGLPEVVIHEKTGFLFPVDDPLSAVNLAVNLLSDPTRHRAMREAAIIRSRDFSHKQIVSVYENFYRRLLHKSLAPSDKDQVKSGETWGTA